jgi:hypothetical protein
MQPMMFEIQGHTMERYEYVATDEGFGDWGAALQAWEGTPEYDVVADVFKATMKAATTTGLPLGATVATAPAASTKAAEARARVLAALNGGNAAVAATTAATTAAPAEATTTTTTTTTTAAADETIVAPVETTTTPAPASPVVTVEEKTTTTTPVAEVAAVAEASESK